MNINEQFKQEKIILNLTRYEIYYKVTLGYLCTKISVELKEQELEIQYMLGSIYELFKELENEENLKDIFEDELKKQASMDALQFFVNENLDEVKNGNLEVEQFVNKINDNELFNETMNKICLENEQLLIQKWETTITEDLANAILTSLKNLEDS